MFGRRKKNPKAEASLFDYCIRLNVHNISEWIGSSAEIGCDAQWKSSDSNVVGHIINYLPKAGVYFHRTPGAFSESVAGSYRTRDDLDIEWGISDDHFIVRLPTENNVVFCCPTARASQMLSSGDNATTKLVGESNLINIELGDESKHTACRKVLEKTWGDYCLGYSNDLVEVIFESAPQNNVLYYESYLDSK